MISLLFFSDDLNNRYHLKNNIWIIDCKYLIVKFPYTLSIVWFCWIVWPTVPYCSFFANQSFQSQYYLCSKYLNYSHILWVYLIIYFVNFHEYIKWVPENMLTTYSVNDCVYIILVPKTIWPRQKFRLYHWKTSNTIV